MGEQHLPLPLPAARAARACSEDARKAIAQIATFAKNFMPVPPHHCSDFQPTAQCHAAKVHEPCRARPPSAAVATPPSGLGIGCERSFAKVLFNLCLTTPAGKRGGLLEARRRYKATTGSL